MGIESRHAAEIPTNLLFICLCTWFRIAGPGVRSTGFILLGRSTLKAAVKAQPRVALFEKPCARERTIVLPQALLASVLGNHDGTCRQKVLRSAAEQAKCCRIFFRRIVRRVEKDQIELLQLRLHTPQVRPHASGLKAEPVCESQSRRVGPQT